MSLQIKKNGVQPKLSKYCDAILTQKLIIITTISYIIFLDTFQAKHKTLDSQQNRK